MAGSGDRNEFLGRIARASGWVFDIDGTLMRTTKAGGEGGTAVAGGPELLRDLQDKGRRVLICTQASTRPPAAYAAILREAGYAVAADDVITAGFAAALHLADAHPHGRILVLGSEGLLEPLRLAGLDCVGADCDGIDAVVVGYARNYETRTLDTACRAVIGGAGFYTTTDDVWFHGGLGRSLAPSGFIASSLGTVCGRKPTVLGKPSPILAKFLLRRLGLAGPDVVVVDDNIAHGIRLAHVMGALSVMPLSGASGRADVECLAEDDAPGLVCEDIGDLAALLAGRLLPRP